MIALLWFTFGVLTHAVAQLVYRLAAKGYERHKKRLRMEKEAAQNTEMEIVQATKPKPITAADIRPPSWQYFSRDNITGEQRSYEMHDSSTGVSTHTIAVEVAPGSWRWQPDTQWLSRMQKQSMRRRELFHALSSRLLTKEEMEEVEREGDRLNSRDGCGTGDSGNQQRIELMTALYNQARLRLLADSLKEGKQ